MDKFDDIREIGKFIKDKFKREDIDDLKNILELNESNETKKQSNFKQLLLQPTVFIALITALVGPGTLAYFSYVSERAKHRTSILSEVLKLTSNQDFDKEPGLIRAGVIASIVNENSSKFGMSLQNSEIRFKELSENLKAISTKALEAEVFEQQNEIQSLNEKNNNYQKTIDENKVRLIEIDREAKNVNKNNKVKIEQLQIERMKLAKNTIKLLADSNEAKSELSRLDSELRNAKTQLDQRDNRVKELAKENEERLKALKNKEDEILNANNSIDELKKALTDALGLSSKYKNQSDKLLNALNRAKDESEQLKGQVKELKAEIEKDKHKIDVVAAPSPGTTVAPPIEADSRIFIRNILNVIKSPGENLTSLEIDKALSDANAASISNADRNSLVQLKNNFEIYDLDINKRLSSSEIEALFN